MKMQSGFTALVHGVASFLAQQGVTADVRLGWRESSKRGNQGPAGGPFKRVLFVPADGTRGGVIAAPFGPGWRPLAGVSPAAAARPLASWEQTITCFIWAVDATDSTTLANEGAQIEATTNLLEKVIQALHVTGLADIKSFSNTEWTTPGANQMLGRELKFSFVYRFPLFDVTAELVKVRGRVERDPEP